MQGEMKEYSNSNMPVISGIHIGLQLLCPKPLFDIQYCILICPGSYHAKVMEPKFLESDH